MPVTTTYPGVYIEEVPSGVRTITGVATSITAFIGRAKRGPVNEAKTINSYSDFERIFGGLWAESTMSFAVRDFYLNGGSQAIIVRLFHPTFASEADRQAAFDAAETEAQTAADAVSSAAADAVAGAATPQDVANAAAPVTKARLSVGGLDLEAAYPGEWSNSLRVRVDHDVVGPDAANIFNLSIQDGGTGQVELFRNVSVQANHLRRVDKVLEQQSLLVRTFGALPGARPAASGAVAPGQDPFGSTTSSGVTTTASDGQALSSGDYTGSLTNKKGLYALARGDFHGVYLYTPLISRPRGFARLIQFFSERVLERDHRDVVAMFAGSEALTPEEIEELALILEKEQNREA